MTARLEHAHDAASIAARLRAGPKAGYLRDWVYGGVDGAVTTFAIVAGVVGADLSPTIVLVLGSANLLADGFSMAAANYASAKTEIDDARRLRRMEERHIDLAPAGEREEVRQLLAAKGFAGADLEHAVAVVTAERARWVEFMMTEEHGAPKALRSPRISALSTFAAFVLCGAAPLAPYALGASASLALATALTAVVFFAIGSLKSAWSLSRWWISGAETTLIGMSAAAIAYGVGWLLSGLGG